MIRNVSSRARRAVVLVVTSVAMSTLGVAAPARADTLEEYLQNVATIQVGTLNGTYNVFQEFTLINVAFAQYLLQQANNGNGTVGQAALNGEYPSSIFNAPGEMQLLSFHWIDTTSGSPVAGPTVDQVDYYISPDPNDPFTYSFYGSSTDSGSNFSLPYTIGTTESEFRAVPFFDGDPIVILGLDDYNVAEGYVASLIPEPTSWILLGTGAAMLGMFRRKRKC
jgi:hypothetical protein